MAHANHTCKGIQFLRCVYGQDRWFAQHYTPTETSMFHFILSLFRPDPPIIRCCGCHAFNEYEGKPPLVQCWRCGMTTPTEYFSVTFVSDGGNHVLR